MRFLTTVSLLALSCAAQADSVRGTCERDGVRLSFTDGIAFPVSRSADGTVSTEILLTVDALDRAAVAAACADCAEPLPENSAMSSRAYTVQTKSHKGFMRISHVGGEMNHTSIVDVSYLDKTGTLFGIGGGDGKVMFDVFDEKRIAGKVTDVPDEYSEPDDAVCDVTFDLAVGWPAKP